jgi:hypothetical protein
MAGRACGLLVALVAAASFLSLPAESATLRTAASQTCIATGVCATLGDRPDPVGASSANRTRFVGDDTSLTNNSGNKLSQVTFVETIPAGFAFVKDDLGACTATSSTVVCLHGLLPDGQTVANTLVFSTPALPAGPDQTSTFAGTWCWAGCDSHNPGANRIDSINLFESTTVRSQTGFDATFVMAGTEADLATGTSVSGTDQLEGGWTIPGQKQDLAATATKKANPNGFQACPADGQLCRSGDWFAALSPGTTSFSPFSEVVYTQDKSLVPSGTTEKNYAVVYTPCLPGDGTTPPPGGCVAVRLARCVSATDLRCTEFVTKLPGGDYRVGVRIGSHNGYMH